MGWARLKKSRQQSLITFVYVVWCQICAFWGRGRTLSDYWYETRMFWQVAEFDSWEERGWEFVWSNKASFFCVFRVKTARPESRNRTEAIMGCMEGWLCVQAWLCGHGGHGNCLSPQLTNLLPSLRNTNQNQREREGARRKNKQVPA